MSRVGRMPISLPAGVEVAIQGTQITVKGPNGVLSQSLPEGVAVSLDDGVLRVSRAGDDRRHRALHGLARSLLANMVMGVSQGFRKDLEITGVGYRVQKAGEKLVLQLGYSHPVEVSPPEGIAFAVESINRLSVLGINKQLVGQVAAEIRAIRPPEPYKGKGVAYRGERIRRKAGKAGKR
ncbi:MAG: 50S ribosomal protein L6 [Chloroflexi bacterium]|nr:50S ribosomal protein L6 [Chloroflexota bacterium]